MSLVRSRSRFSAAGRHVRRARRTRAADPGQQGRIGGHRATIAALTSLSIIVGGTVAQYAGQRSAWPDGSAATVCRNRHWCRRLRWQRNSDPSTARPSSRSPAVAAVPAGSTPTPQAPAEPRISDGTDGDGKGAFGHGGTLTGPGAGGTGASPGSGHNGGNGAGTGGGGAPANGGGGAGVAVTAPRLLGLIRRSCRHPIPSIVSGHVRNGIWVRIRLPATAGCRGPVLDQGGRTVGTTALLRVADRRDRHRRQVWSAALTASVPQDPLTPAWVAQERTIGTGAPRSPSRAGRSWFDAGSSSVQRRRWRRPEHVHPARLPRRLGSPDSGWSVGFLKFQRCGHRPDTSAGQENRSTR